MPAFMREVKALTLETALKAAGEIGYPLSVRPAYKYGGRGGMRIVYNDQDLGSFMRAAAKEEGIAFCKVEDRLWTELGEGVHLDAPDDVIDLRVSDSDRKGHSWCFGTTRVGKTRMLENIVEQDIRKGYSVVVVDPKGDIDLFSKITQIACDTGRIKDLMMVTPIFPEYSAILDPLSSYYMPEELVAHITAGVAIGKEPFFFGVAYENSLVLVQALLELAKGGTRTSFSLLDVKNKIGHGDLRKIRNSIDYFDTPEAKQISLSLQKILETTPDYYNNVVSSLRVALTELTSGNIGRIIGTAHENRFISRLEEGKQVIMVVQLGSLLTKKASYTAGKVVVSMLQSLIGRKLASGKKIDPPLALHIDEAQNILYQGIEDLFAKAGAANIYLHGYSQSVNQMFAEVGQERANTILDNCNTKTFMRVPDAVTAKYISDHLGEKRTFSPIISLGGGLAIRETEDVRVKASGILRLTPRQFYMITYSGIYKGFSRTVPDSALSIIYPDAKTADSEELDAEAVEEKAAPGESFLELFLPPAFLGAVMLAVIWGWFHWSELQEMYEHIHGDSLVAFGAQLLAAMGLFGVSGLVGWLFWLRRKERQRRIVEECDRERLIVNLKEICSLWVPGKEKRPPRLEVKNGKIQVSLEGVAHIWREPGDVDEADAEPVEEMGPVVLRNERAAKFFKQFENTDKAHRDVIARLLLLLDQEGDCASVVSQQTTNDIETSWGNTYERLGKVSLLDHSLNVAETVIAELTREESGHMINDAVIAALGHDIGKLPSKQPAIYSYGDHYLGSAEVLTGIPGFSRLSKKPKIIEAVKLHHKPAPEQDMLTKILQEADKKARQAELELVNKQMGRKKKKKNGIKQQTATASQPAANPGESEQKVPVVQGEVDTAQPANSPQAIQEVQPENQPASDEQAQEGMEQAPEEQPKIETPAAPAPVIQPPTAPVASQADAKAGWKAQQDIYGIGGDEQPARNNRKKQADWIEPLDIRGWLDVESCLAEIKSRINVMNGRYFQAFSMPTGTVYIHTGLIRDILVDQAKKGGVEEIVMRDPANSIEMRPLLLGADSIFRARNLIDTTQVKEGYFGGYFSLNLKNGEQEGGFYAPFKAEAFLAPGESIGGLEQRKTGKLAEIATVTVQTKKGG